MDDTGKTTGQPCSLSVKALIVFKTVGCKAKIYRGTNLDSSNIGSPVYGAILQWSFPYCFVSSI